MRCANWDLRILAIKKMAALFDRPHYSKLIAQHIADLLSVPKELASSLNHGGFVVSLQDETCECVGIHEAHEMCINRECKEYISRPCGESMNTLTRFHWCKYESST